jgi:hypothetical protein
MDKEERKQKKKEPGHMEEEGDKENTRQKILCREPVG